MSRGVIAAALLLRPETLFASFYVHPEAEYRLTDAILAGRVNIASSLSFLPAVLRIPRSVPALFFGPVCYSTGGASHTGRWARSVQRENISARRAVSKRGRHGITGERLKLRDALSKLLQFTRATWLRVIAYGRL